MTPDHRTLSAASFPAEEAELDVFEFVPTREHQGQRLDRYVADAFPALSRVFVRRLIEHGQVLVDGHSRRPAFKVTPGEVITVEIPPTEEAPLLPEAIPLDIVYEDHDLIVLNKPAGLVVHPAPGHPTGTLVNALLAHAPAMSVSGSHRPGIVHRLDKDTSGLMVVAKNDRAKLALISQWQSRTVDKGYVALVRGVVGPDDATIDAPIDRDPTQRKKMATALTGRPAITHFNVRRRYRGATLLDIALETGRTHQVRVHLAFIGHPIVGDPVYNPHTGPTGGRNSLAPRQFLHASRLGFELPDGTRRTFQAPLPGDLCRALDAFAAADAGQARPK
jgi:23S rRNA pseudouridine1911/1915/1917 synthase